MRGLLSLLGFVHTNSNSEAPRLSPFDSPGLAGKPEPGEGETTQAIRRRLAAAAEALGNELQVRRSANAVYFWAPEAPRRGRPRKNPAA